MKKRPELAHFFRIQCQLHVGSNVRVKSIYLFDNYRFCSDWRILQLIKIDSHRFKSFYIKQGGFHSCEAIFILKFWISSILIIPICCSKKFNNFWLENFFICSGPEASVTSNCPHFMRALKLDYPNAFYAARLNEPYALLK